MPSDERESRNIRRRLRAAPLGESESAFFPCFDLVLDGTVVATLYWDQGGAVGFDDAGETVYTDPGWFRYFADDATEHDEIPAPPGPVGMEPAIAAAKRAVARHLASPEGRGLLARRGPPERVWGEGSIDESEFPDGGETEGPSGGHAQAPGGAAPDAVSPFTGAEYGEGCLRLPSSAGRFTWGRASLEAHLDLEKPDDRETDEEEPDEE